jgi:hypothetical protein
MRRLLAFGAAYILHPPWAKWAQRILLVACYVMMGILGWLIVVGVTVGVNGSGWAVSAGALLSLVGSALRYYQVEAIGIWPQITGLITVAILGGVGPTGALLVTAYAFLLGLRLLELNVVAWNARKALETPGGVVP